MQGWQRGPLTSCPGPRTARSSRCPYMYIYTYICIIHIHRNCSQLSVPWLPCPSCCLLHCSMLLAPLLYAGVSLLGSVVRAQRWHSVVQHYLQGIHHVPAGVLSAGRRLHSCGALPPSSIPGVCCICHCTRCMLHMPLYQVPAYTRIVHPMHVGAGDAISPPNACWSRLCQAQMRVQVWGREMKESAPAEDIYTHIYR